RHTPDGRQARPLREHEGRLGNVPHHRGRAAEARGGADAPDAPRRGRRLEEAGRRRRLYARAADRHAAVLRADDRLVRADGKAADIGGHPRREDGRQDRQVVGIMRTHALRIAVASVWLVHGLYNKLLGGSPRHLAIVQSVPGLAGATGVRVLTAVGVCEGALALWILSGRSGRGCAFTQTVALLSMNAFELTFARDLLLWPAGLLPLNIGFLALAWTAAGVRWPAILRARLQRHPVPVDAHFDD